MFEHSELHGTQMGHNGPPNAKGAAYIAPEIANYRKPGLWSHFGHFGQNSHLGHFHGGNAAFCSRQPRKINSAALFFSVEIDQASRL